MSQQMLNKNVITKEVRVIIVEDYKLTRVGLRFALNEIENINVIAEAQNAEIGLDLIRKEQPDVVLMDLGLPGINGLEATAKVKNISPNTKIIICEPFRVDDRACFMKDYAIEARKIAEEFNLPFVALQEKLEQAVEVYGRHACFHDGLHPNIVGSKIISNEWLKVFKKEIEKE